MNWGELKLETLRKMFSSEGTTINMSDEAVREYVLGMPQVANEAMRLICTDDRNGKYLRKQYEFTGGGVIDLYAEIFDLYSIGDKLECYELTDTGMQPIIGATVFDGQFLTIPKSFKGDGILFYNAYPQTITNDTADKTRINLDPEAVVILPLYMASELYKDDDITLSQTWRNEFEVAREGLKNRPMGMKSSAFSGISGWV